MSLSLAGQEPFLDWVGWEPSLNCIERRSFIAWVRPSAATGSGHDSGIMADPCGDAQGAEWGVCDFELRDFGRLRRRGPVRDVTMVNVKLCEMQPRYRLDGSPITDDLEFDMRIATEALMQDLKYRIITGSAATPGDFAGLENLVRTGYRNTNGSFCPLMDSIVVNMNGNGMGGGNGMTWNNVPIASSFSFIDILLAAYRRVVQRLSWSPALAAQQLQVGNVVLVAPTHLVRCILDAYTCWSVCPGGQYTPATIQTYEARTFRDSLNGGMFGFGRVFLDGFEVPIIAYDWGLIKTPTRSDCYLLTGAVGNQRLMIGQFNDMRAVAAEFPDRYQATDGGRLLVWTETDMTCIQTHVEIRPRLLLSAPWAQVRFQNVACTQVSPLISPDPWETSFFPETSFKPAKC